MGWRPRRCWVGAPLTLTLTLIWTLTLTWVETQKEPTRVGRLFLDVMCGGVLLSREASLAVPSALRGLTSGFGMGPGVSPSLWPPQPYGDAVGLFPAVSREPHSGRERSMQRYVCVKPSAC
jgi:hypothetical protein